MRFASIAVYTRITDLTVTGYCTSIEKYAVNSNSKFGTRTYNPSCAITYVRIAIAAAPKASSRSFTTLRMSLSE